MILALDKGLLLIDINDIEWAGKIVDMA